jgi:uncharacterized delta-60 repeat protein
VQLPVLNGRAPGTTSVTIQADDRIVVAGYYWDPQGIHPALFRFNPDGTPDATFGAGGSVYTGWGLDYGNEFWDVVVLPNGKILAGGNVTDSRTSATVHNFFAARFNPDGTPDLSFGAAGRTLGVDFGNTFDRARALLVMPDGKVLLGGETSFDRGLGGFWAPSVFALARFTADGRLDTGFGPPAGGGGKLTTPVPGRDYTSARIKDLLLQPDGSVLAVGSAEKRSGDGDFAVARFRPDFTLDPSFDGDGFALADFGGYDEGFAGALQGDGSVVVAGVTRRGAGATRNSFALARFGPSGALDPTFGAGGKVTTPFEGPGAIASGPAQAVTLLPDGGILAAGYGGVARYARGGMRVTVVEPGPSVAGRHVFYNHSAFDGDDAAANAGDDAAIAAGKSALLPGPGAPSSFANATSYSKGLNGLMVDIAGLPAGPGLTAADFSFRARRADGSWYEYAAPASVSVRRGAGVDGSDRVTLVWPDYNPAAGSPAMALVNAWLEVTVKANANTGLSSPDVFSFGNLAGDTGDSPTSLRVNALDLAALKRGLNSSATLASTIDLNRDGRINALDLAIIKRNLNSTLSLLAAPAAAPQGVALATPGLFDGDASATRRPADDLLL